MLIKALALALIEVPECNVSFAGDQLIKYQRADISVAVSIPNGLITPIITGAEGKAISAISKEMTDLAGRAKEGKLQPNEYQGGTASLSNMHRRNNIPPWRTDGSTEITPPYWLAISVLDPDYKRDDGAVFSEGNSYAERSRRPDGGREIDTEGTRTICIWPRQVVGGLFSLMRFAKELQRCLITVCNQGTIECLMPAAEG